MMGDIWTVIWKEKKGLFRQQGSRTRSILTLLVPFAMMALYFPWEMGREWVEGYVSLFAAFVVPLITVGTAVPESFAGERERHTLETLLASRLPDRAILLGKLATAIGYGIGMTLIVLALGLVTLNVVHWEGQVLFYEPAVLIANLGATVGISGLLASLGIFISLRASTVQTAQQVLISAFLIPLMALTMVPMILISAVPDGRKWVQTAFDVVGSTEGILVIIGILLALNAALLAAAMVRFRRTRLILD